MALEGRLKRAVLNITRIIKILKQIINDKYKEGEAHDSKVSAEKMRNTSVSAMISVIALYLDYEKGKEVCTETRKVSWNGSDVDPISTIKDLILEGTWKEKLMDDQISQQTTKNRKYQIYDVDFDFNFDVDFDF